MIKRSANRNIKTSPEIIRLAVMVYLRFLPKLRNGEDFFHARGIKTSHETGLLWEVWFGPMLAPDSCKLQLSGLRIFYPEPSKKMLR